MSVRPVLGFAALTAVALTLSGCVANNAAGADALAVDITDDGCAVSSSTAASGAITFTATNNGTAVNEFEILAEDKLRIVGEKENITPGQTVDYVLQLEPGTYYTECKLGMVGAGIGTAEFTVTGGGTVDADEQERVDAAVTNYVSYVKDQVGELVTAVDTFTDAYASGDDETARSLYPATRVHYERIEPTAEAFGDLDPKLDFREPMAEEDGIAFTGFHRIEKDLWAPDGFTPSDAVERRALADGLVTDVATLYELVYSENFTVSLSDISNGAIGLLDEVAASKITGEEDAFSHTDLWDFQANVEGASVAYGNVREIAEARGEDGAELVNDIDEQFENLDSLLSQHGSLEDGFVLYDQLTPDQVRELSDGINALAEPLALLTHTVLDIAEPTE